MKLQERLEADMKEALRRGQKERLGVIRLLRSSLGYATMALGPGKELDEPGVLQVLAKEARQRRESIEEYTKVKRLDMAAREEAELAIILSYLPQQASHEEIAAAARAIIAEVGARGPGDKGKVMPQLVAQFRGKAEGSVINAVVTELLGGK
ncbi:MAG: GatB/YqeY domain-containing protein [Chloroflexi bacterium]|nr:GatB/YqeY domain-containing protein [Chloroflexota bacterium]